MAATRQSDTPFEGEVTFTQNNQTRTLNLANQIDAVPLSTTGSGSGSNGETVQTSANPVIPNSCGIDTTLVLDASGSISNAGAVQDVRDASNALLNTLKDTKSTARILQFSNNSQQLATRTLIDGTTFNQTAFPPIPRQNRIALERDQWCQRLLQRFGLRELDQLGSSHASGCRGTGS